MRPAHGVLLQRSSTGRLQGMTIGFVWRVWQVDWRVLRVTDLSIGLFWIHDRDRNPTVYPLCIEPLHSLSPSPLSSKTLQVDSLIGRSGKDRIARPIPKRPACSRN